MNKMLQVRLKQKKNAATKSTETTALVCVYQTGTPRLFTENPSLPLTLLS